MKDVGIPRDKVMNVSKKKICNEKSEPRWIQFRADSKPVGRTEQNEPRLCLSLLAET